MRERDLSDFDITVKACSDLDERERALIFAQFEAAYRDANRGYLEKSFGVLKYAALAMHGETLAGFSLGEMRVIDLPRLPQTVCALAGICCIDDAYRRRGLFGALEAQAMRASGVALGGRYLACGRMAHPASYRVMSQNASAVPKRGAAITSWQRDVGSAIAKAYGAHAFDPATFVCIGPGTPIGYPAMDVEAAPEEWEVFAAVDRDRGDSLLGICWHPDAPEGWSG